MGIHEKFRQNLKTIPFEYGVFISNPRFQPLKDSLNLLEIEMINEAQLKIIDYIEDILQNPPKADSSISNNDIFLIISEIPFIDDYLRDLTLDAMLYFEEYHEKRKKTQHDFISRIKKIKARYSENTENI